MNERADGHKSMLSSLKIGGLGGVLSSRWVFECLNVTRLFVIIN